MCTYIYFSKSTVKYIFLYFYNGYIILKFCFIIIIKIKLFDSRHQAWRIEVKFVWQKFPLQFIAIKTKTKTSNKISIGSLIRIRISVDIHTTFQMFYSPAFFRCLYSYLVIFLEFRIEPFIQSTTIIKMNMLTRVTKHTIMINLPI